MPRSTQPLHRPTNTPCGHGGSSDARRGAVVGGGSSRRAVNPVTGFIRVMVEVVFMGLLGSGFKVCCSRFSVLVDHSGFVFPRLPR